MFLYDLDLAYTILNLGISAGVDREDLARRRGGRQGQKLEAQRAEAGDGFLGKAQPAPPR